MNYRHLYHAGNFADVLKHVIMMLLLKTLAKKETPFCFLDTHAGIGLYPLQSVEAQKSKEFESGIEKLLSLSIESAPEIIQEYLSIIHELDADHYPGSPYIASKIMRSQDQLILCELHPADVQTLKKNMLKQKNIIIHCMDGYFGMKAFLPPKLKRGMVMIDPPFEVINEFECVVKALERMLTHWQSGNVMIWYPIKNEKAVQGFYRALRDIEKPILIVEFSLNHSADPNKLSACGIAMVNPPWKVEEILRNDFLPYLASALDAHWRLL